MYNNNNFFTSVYKDKENLTKSLRAVKWVLVIVFIVYSIRRTLWKQKKYT